jgi:hypothetical protein
MIEHPPDPGVSVSRACPKCSAVVAVMNERPPKRYVRDALGRVGEVMQPPYPATSRVWLRPPNGGREWDVDAGTVTPVNADGSPLQEDA